MIPPVAPYCCTPSPSRPPPPPLPGTLTLLRQSTPSLILVLLSPLLWHSTFPCSRTPDLKVPSLFLLYSTTPFPSLPATQIPAPKFLKSPFYCILNHLQYPLSRYSNAPAYPPYPLTLSFFTRSPMYAPSLSQDTQPTLVVFQPPLRWYSTPSFPTPTHVLYPIPPPPYRTPFPHIPFPLL